VNHCPYCEKELPTQKCPHCDENTLEESVFCHKCGQRIIPVQISDDPEDWENRTLCSDGNCIGVVGADGMCKECGKPYAPELENEKIAELQPEITEDKTEEKTDN
jgi:hypothetical protein